MRVWHALCNNSKPVSLVVNNRVIVLGAGREISPFSLVYLIELLLSEEHLYRASEEVEVTTEFILQEAAVRLANVLWKVAEECKRRRTCRKLCHILDLDVLALPCWWRIILDLWKHDLIKL